MTSISLKLMIATALVALSSTSCKSVDRSASEIASSNGKKTLSDVEVALTKILGPKFSKYSHSVETCGWARVKGETFREQGCLTYVAKNSEGQTQIDLVIYKAKYKCNAPKFCNPQFIESLANARIGCANTSTGEGYASEFAESDHILTAKFVCSKPTFNADPSPTLEIIRKTVDATQPSLGAVVRITSSKGETTEIELTEKPIYWKDSWDDN